MNDTGSDHVIYGSSGRGPQLADPTPSVRALSVTTVAELSGRSMEYSGGTICSSVCGSAETCIFYREARSMRARLIRKILESITNCT